MKWLRDTLINEEFRSQIYWSTTEGITNLYFTIDARRWMTLVAQRIRSVGQPYYCHLSSCSECGGTDSVGVKGFLSGQQEGLISSQTSDSVV